MFQMHRGELNSRQLNACDKWSYIIDHGNVKMLISAVVVFALCCSVVFAVAIPSFLFRRDDAWFNCQKLENWFVFFNHLKWGISIIFQLLRLIEWYWIESITEWQLEKEMMETENEMMGKWRQCCSVWRLPGWAQHQPWPKPENSKKNTKHKQ